MKILFLSVLLAAATAQTFLGQPANLVIRLNQNKVALQPNQDSFQQGTRDSQLGTNNHQQRVGLGSQQSSRDPQQRLAAAQQGTGSFQQSSRDSQQRHATTQQGADNFQQSSRDSQQRLAAAQQGTDSFQQSSRDSQQRHATTQQGTGSFQQSSRDSQQRLAAAQQGTDSFQQSSRDSQQRLAAAQQGTDSFQQSSRDSQQRLATAQQGTGSFQQSFRDSQQRLATAQQGTDGFQQSSQDSQQRLAAAQQELNSFQQNSRGSQQISANFQQELRRPQQVSGTSQVTFNSNQQRSDRFQESSLAANQGIRANHQTSGKFQQDSGVTREVFDNNEGENNLFQLSFSGSAQGLTGSQRGSSQVLQRSSDSQGGNTLQQGASALQLNNNQRTSNFQLGSTDFQSQRRQTSLSQLQQGTGRLFLQGSNLQTSANSQLINNQISGSGAVRFSETLKEEVNGVLEPLNLPSGARLLLGDISTTFSCTNQPYGYFADEENFCRVFHVCYPVMLTNGIIKTNQYSFMCGEGSKFDQRETTCVHDADAIPCNTSYQFYAKNAQFGFPQDRDAFKK